MYCIYYHLNIKDIKTYISELKINKENIIIDISDNK